MFLKALDEGHVVLDDLVLFRFQHVVIVSLHYSTIQYFRRKEPLVNEPDESKTIQVKLSTGELYYDYPWIKQSSGVITTNYTPCVEWFNVDCDKIAYVHGKLSWFEFPFSLEVVDCIRQEEYFNTLRESGQIYFPFLMATSSIKPIIHPLQMKEYHRAQSILDRSKTLVCIGHGLSGDDIHITTMIRLWLIQRKDRRFLYCSYNTADDEVEKINIQIHEKLCLPLNTEFSAPVRRHTYSWVKLPA
jgi:hypothetical protein